MLRFTQGLLPAGGSHAQRAGGRPLPPYTRRRMEQLFGVSFEDVRIHVDGVPGQVGAVAFTSGSDIYFAPGHFDPATPHGLQLLAHELTHVVQQRSGRVRSSAGGGAAIVDDPALEEEARQMGARAMSGTAPPFLPAAHEYHRGVSAAQRGRDMRVIQRMPGKQTFAETIGQYGSDADGTVYLTLNVSAVLYHSTDANLEGQKLNVPAFLTQAGTTSYGSKEFAFAVQREAQLVLLNDAENLTRLLKYMDSTPGVRDALKTKAGVTMSGSKVTGFHVMTASMEDKTVAQWFQSKGIDGWYIDSSRGNAMKFDEAMIAQADVLSAGKRFKI